jgi:glycerophosphoryl diester phosphodiesterase
MLPSTHQYLENTISSMRAGFTIGADIVELDVHPTTDGEFAVFHDWTLDCRTDGRGVTREHSMAYLKKLDIGHGYTADGGKTFPFRGKGIGLMPTLTEVLATFPEQRLLINVKSRDPSEGEKARGRIEQASRRTPGADHDLWRRRASRDRAPADARRPNDLALDHQKLPPPLHRLRLERRGAESLQQRDGDAADQRYPVAIGLARPFPQPHESRQQRGLRARPLSRQRVLDRNRYT